MKCGKCGGDFEEKDIQESHDVPCYLFEGEKRNIRKNQADKWGRHWLCKKYHKKYELGLAFHLLKSLSQEMRNKLKERAKKFAERWFNESNRV